MTIDRVADLARQLHVAARPACECPHRCQRVVIADGARVQLCAACNALVARLEEPES